MNIEDVFLGFNEETLTSLVLLHSNYSAVCFTAEREDIINACKRDLINIASSFLMLILPRSKLFYDNQQEAMQIMEIYKQGNKHDSLMQYMEFLLRTSQYLPGGRFIVYTYSNILYNMDKILE